MPRKRFSTEHIVTTLRQAEVELGRGLHVQVVRTSADRWFRSPILHPQARALDVTPPARTGAESLGFAIFVKVTGSWNCGTWKAAFWPTKSSVARVVRIRQSRSITCPSLALV